MSNESQPLQEEARRYWRNVFESLDTARDKSKTAWYQVEDKQAFKEEEIHRLQALINAAQKAIRHWEGGIPS